MRPFTEEALNVRCVCNERLKIFWTEHPNPSKSVLTAYHNGQRVILWDVEDITQRYMSSLALSSVFVQGIGDKLSDLAETDEDEKCVEYWDLITDCLNEVLHMD